MLVHYFAPALDNITSVAGKNQTDVSLNRLTIENVAAGSKILYVHVAFAYVFTIYIFFLLYHTWIEFIEIKKASYATDEYLKSFHNRIVLFTNNSKLKDVESFTEYLTSLRLKYPPDQVLLGRDYSELDKLVQKHYELTIEFEKVLNKCMSILI
jgi:hypothetical protein